MHKKVRRRMREACTEVLRHTVQLISLEAGRRLLARMLAMRAWCGRGLVAGAVAAALAAGPLQAKGPFIGDIVVQNGRPALADLNGDGNLDLIVGVEGQLRLYRNDGGAGPLGTFTRVRGAADPFATVSIVAGATPSFADIDGDGDRDLILGQLVGGQSRIGYYRNSGSATEPLFVERSGSQNPFDGLNNLGINEPPSPAFADLDGDGDQDALIGLENGAIRYYRNDSSGNTLSFTQRTNAANPLNRVDVGDLATLDLTDHDGDGDFDLLVGNEAGRLQLFRNDGTPTAPDFTLVDAADNPFGAIEADARAAPALGDIDQDGDLDLYLGGRNQTILFWRNLGDGAYQNVFSTTNPLGNVQVNPSSPGGSTFMAAPAFADIDADGDLDAFVGDAVGELHFFRNNGTPTAPDFSAESDANPFSGQTFDRDVVPAFADLDNDNDLDAIIGAGSSITIFRNTGSASEPAFLELPPDEDPFSALTFSIWSHVAVADIDADGDFDLFVGSAKSDQLRFFRNESTGSELVFTEQTTTDSPFAGISFGVASNVATFGDIDGDGDIDALLYDANTRALTYFRNLGTPEEAIFIPQVPEANPFDDIQIGAPAMPVLVDINNDGDLDLFAGNSSGRITWFENREFSQEPTNDQYRIYVSLIRR